MKNQVTTIVHRVNEMLIKKTIIITMLIILSTTGKAYSANDIYTPIKFSRNEVVFSDSSLNINAIDPTPQNNSIGSIFPGGRGPNQLVIYTSKFGDRTNTNEYGTEAIVQGNTVTMISGANSFIPIDGIVISGHGSAKVWMNQNITIGTKVYIDKENNTIKTYTTSESYTFEAENKISEAKSMIDYYKGRVPNYNPQTSNNHIAEAQEYLKKAKKDIDDQSKIKKYTKLAVEEADAAIIAVLPYMPEELKGVWIRPTETSEFQIVSTLNKMKDMGIDNVFLETFYHGKTIFPSQTMKSYGFISQNEQFSSFDPLKIWIREAHKRNIKVHIWFQSFYVGNIPPSKNSQSILAVHPEWGNKTKSDYLNKMPTSSRSEHNGYFLDPANPKVQEFLIKLLTEIICVYKPDGINLDYIRYPQAITKNESGSWGYTEYARSDFKDLYGVDPVSIKYSDDNWKDWENYRREKITNFVAKVGTLGRSNKVYISTVIFPDVEAALNTKQQDWRTWSKRDFVDGFTALFLTYDPKMLSSMMSDVMKIKSGKTNIYAGIFVTFMGGSNEDLVRQIHETRKLKADGVILFDYAHTKPEQYSKTLSNGAFKQTKKIEPQPEPKKKKRGFWIFGKKK